MKEQYKQFLAQKMSADEMPLSPTPGTDRLKQWSIMYSRLITMQTLMQTAYFRVEHFEIASETFPKSTVSSC